MPALTPPLPGDFGNTGELLAAAAELYGPREAYVEPGDIRMSFAQWYERANAVAAQLAAHGIRKGDVVALMLPAGVDYATCYAAAALLGAVTTGLNPRLGLREVASILQKSEPGVVIRDHAAGLPDIDSRFPVLARTDLTDSAAPAPVPETSPVGMDDPVAIVFSSGTTGLPKGAWFDAGNLRASAAAAGVMSAPYDRRLSSTPFAHAGYMSKLWDQLIWGTTLVIPPTPWSATGMRDILRDERITVAGAVPTQWTKLLELPEIGRDSFPHLRVGVVATAPASPELVERTAALIGVPLVVRYAMTEAPSICGTDIGDPPDVAFRTVGKPQTGMMLRITDDAGDPVAPGQVGQVRIRGGCVMRGYWNDAAATANAFDDEGYLISGDLGSITADGDLKLAGRSGDLYIRGGFNVHPVEVEQVLAEHPGVKDAAVIGFPAPVIGEIGIAFVVPQEPGRIPGLDELRRWVRQRLADYKAPDHLVALDAIPLTAMAKTDRRQLRQLATAHPPPPR